MRQVTRLCSAVLLLALSACGSPAEETPAERSAWSDTGTFVGTFTLAPSPPTIGKNRVDATLADAAREPLVGAELDVELWMPAHGHGASSTPNAIESAPGQYQIDEIVYEMPGEWVLRVQVRSESTQDVFELPVVVD